MKTLFQPATLARMAAVALCFMLVSFSAIRGGDSYTIFLNDKQVGRYFVYAKEKLPSLTLTADNSDQFSVYYSECGKIGSARKLSVRDDQNKILKEWKFADVSDEHTPMMVKAKDLVTTSGSKFGLYYASEAVPKGQLLANLVIASKENKASR